MECWATLSRTGCREGRQGSLTGPGHVGSGPGRVRELGYSHTRRACRTVAISTLGNYLGESVARVAVVQLAERGSEPTANRCYLRHATLTLQQLRFASSRGADGPRGAGAAGPAPPCAAGHYQGVASCPAAASNDTCHLN